jgi:hypothetical protein
MQAPASPATAAASKPCNADSASYHYYQLPGLAHLRGLRAPPHRRRVLAARSIDLINSYDSMSATCRCSYDSMSARWKDQVTRRSTNNVHDEPTIREEDAHAICTDGEPPALVNSVPCSVASDPADFTERIRAGRVSACG